MRPPSVSSARKPLGASMCAAPVQMRMSSWTPVPSPPSSASHGSCLETSAYGIGEGFGWQLLVRSVR